MVNIKITSNMPSEEMIIDYEASIGKYDNKIKDRCQWCNHRIPDTRAHYMMKGNMCDPCLNRVNKVMQHKINQAEADQMLQERII